MQNLTKERKQPAVVILQNSIFYNIFIRCLRLRIIRRSHYGVQFMNFPSQIFFDDISLGYRAAIFKKNSLWLLPFYMAVATYCYYTKVRRTMRTVIVSHLFKTFQLMLLMFPESFDLIYYIGKIRSFTSVITLIILTDKISNGFDLTCLEIF